MSYSPAPNGISPALPDNPTDSTVGVMQQNGISHHTNQNLDPAMLLELEDGSTYQGHNFGASKSIAGELVFQTGMVGYPESITDPSYRGQILVMTFPLVGNYGAPSREARDAIVAQLPAHFEASEVHIVGLVVASYSGEEYSHHLAASSLGTWLKEQGVPAMYGVDTRALTKKIREKGSMLGKLKIQPRRMLNGITNGNGPPAGYPEHTPGNGDQPAFESVDWFDPNKTNLVADGESLAQSRNCSLLRTNIYEQSQPKSLTSSAHSKLVLYIIPVAAF